MGLLVVTGRHPITSCLTVIFNLVCCIFTGIIWNLVASRIWCACIYFFLTYRRELLCGRSASQRECSRTVMWPCALFEKRRSENARFCVNGEAGLLVPNLGTWRLWMSSCMLHLVHASESMLSKWRDPCDQLTWKRTMERVLIVRTLIKLLKFADEIF